jgi:flavodoxin
MNANTVIVYASKHHGNTKKLLEAIAEQEDVELLDIAENEQYDLSGYDRIGIASGIAYGKYYPQMLKFLENNLPCDKDAFYIHTAGDPRENHADSAKKIAEEKNCRCLGVFYCKGFDTFGPFKLVGGINKNRPNTEDMEQAVQFYRGLNK